MLFGCSALSPPHLEGQAPPGSLASAKPDCTLAATCHAAPGWVSTTDPLALHCSEGGAGTLSGTHAVPVARGASFFQDQAREKPATPAAEPLNKAA